MIHIACKLEIAHLGIMTRIIVFWSNFPSRKLRFRLEVLIFSIIQMKIDEYLCFLTKMDSSNYYRILVNFKVRNRKNLIWQMKMFSSELCNALRKKVGIFA